ncbi:hypothetical protein P9133_32755 [Bacillus thuringiensis]|uniref:Uncharacterized protein n=1 Tax=Bacillus thuringiensis HD-771 TaxID=1218175 RepID=A0A9W3JD73_BACTU|nr:hypothetical protein [Bacillus thuringiensis]AFQ16479.1 hypothetical protein BTG_15145 [Bacillus thuringiensis HD-771]AND06270.1 hypothetical protein Bt4C1_03375 [Bacillus thuringiensis serovar alesti]AND06632.1 hypothetical protein Bt4C1_05385 [Bacillus thuringiensis serovar alesti]AND10497.1 hypothetical protein Bt4C1_25905 [Bacillus thuringiensis serovar alesti]MEC3269078.1 hypothetical protein [Bacillus thuringiensis]
MDCKHEFIEFRVHSKITDICPKCGHIAMGSLRTIKPNEKLKGFSTDELKREIDIRADYEK